MFRSEYADVPAADLPALHSPNAVAFPIAFYAAARAASGKILRRELRECA
ncbi:hypothetical protein [Streptomyces acidiscabies]